MWWKEGTKETMIMWSPFPATITLERQKRTYKTVQESMELTNSYEIWAIDKWSRSSDKKNLTWAGITRKSFKEEARGVWANP